MLVPKRRGASSGITLTEILISILIMGVGIISLATLFPLGLLRLRDATRMSRSAILTESAAGDLEARDLLNKMSFTNTNYSPWYFGNGRQYDPWVQDTPSYGADPFDSASGYGIFRGVGPAQDPSISNPPSFRAGSGLYVAYDPLWRHQTGIYLNVNGQPEARFASGIGFVRPDPNGGNRTDPSAHGLQRITNFNPSLPGYTYPNPASIPLLHPMSSSVPDIFVSPEDIVLQSGEDSGAGSGTYSPIVPDLKFSVNELTHLETPQFDWKYTWMFTGRQADCTNGSVFEGDIVVFENRPFAFDPSASVFASNGGTPYFSSSTVPTGAVAGETVVEAVFGYTGNVRTTGTAGYGSNASRAVLLRWSDKMPDPEIKVGNWIADVTYERNATEDLKRAYTDPSAGAGSGTPEAYYPYQRCYWYQVSKRTDPTVGQAFTGDPGGVTYREMTVWVSTPLRAFTLLNSSNGSPYHVNAALVSPYVVSVFPRTFYTR